jgi:ribosomal protein S18 acetylase RimI-like enzyme
LKPEIRTLTTHDIPEADQILRQAFGSPGSRVEELHRCLGVQPDGWLLALLGREPVGMVGAIDYGSFAWIGMMAVLPKMQHHGIGGLLMSEILDWLEGRGCPLVRLDATQAGAGLYRKLGFVQAGLTRMVLDPKLEPLPDHSIPIAPMLEADLPEVAALDEAVFGAYRDSLLRLYWQQYPDRSYIARTRLGELAGYLVAQRTRLGPWISTSLSAAEALLSTALSLSFDDPIKMIVPSENTAALQLFNRLGAIEGQSHLHMVKEISAGRDHQVNLPGQRELIYAQASFAAG